MAPSYPLLWRNLRTIQIYGANTNVGKTVLTTALCRASTRLFPKDQTCFVKPVSTGPQDEADEHHISRFCAPESVHRATLLQYDEPVSPHLSAAASAPDDTTLLRMIRDHAARRAAALGEGGAGSRGWMFLETAGGVHSPGPSGASTQADLYAGLRCPVVLVGDAKLGGISLTVSAFEALRLRGYDVEAVVLFRDAVYGNFEYLGRYFGGGGGRRGVGGLRGRPLVVGVPMPPSRVEGVWDEDEGEDERLMGRYYDEMSEDEDVCGLLKHLDHRHRERIDRLESMAQDAHTKIWYPFTQHKDLKPSDIVPIDSARGDWFQTLTPPLTPASKTDNNNNNNNKKLETTTTEDQYPPLLRPSFDGSASWWTQGLGHSNPSLTLAAAYAAGRYGHVMFPGHIHEPALSLATALLEGLQNPRLSRVFFSDNGSTGAEVALKMALRAARLRYGWVNNAAAAASRSNKHIGVVGLRGAYHGDTLGAMDCAEPGVYNVEIEWYEGRGVWLEYPDVRCVDGRWVVRVSGEIGGGGEEERVFETLAEVFDVEGREARGEHLGYERYIEETLARHVRAGRRFGVLLLEPVVIGAGGMLLVDVLFQRALVNVVRRSGPLFSSISPDVAPSPPSHDDKEGTSWTGLPVVFDEVFTGLYRLGRMTASSFLGVHPDISVHAKLLTGGLVPLSATLASEPIFTAFEKANDKAAALLHGHSYAAHPVGCQVALESLAQLQGLDRDGAWEWAKRDWSKAPPSPSSASSPEKQPGKEQRQPAVYSLWPLDAVRCISRQTSVVAGVWALGSVLAIHMRTAHGPAGYTSTAAAELQAALGRGDRGWNVHSRVLGNVLYLMASQRTTEEDVLEIVRLVKGALV